MPLSGVIDPIKTINGLTIYKRQGTPAQRGFLALYVVFTPDGRALEEFRRFASAARFCRLTRDFCPKGDTHARR